MNQFLSSFLAVLVAVILFSCGNEETQDEVNNPIEETNTLYGNKNVSFPQLSEKVRSYTSQWGAFEDFEGEVKAINGATIEELKNRTERLMSFTDSIVKKLPDTLAIQSIQSRVMVAQTRAHLLDQLVHRTRIDSARLQTYIDEMNIAASNLFIQLNDKFKKDAIDQQRIDTEKKEIEAQKRTRDSIFQQEIKDKNQ